MKQWVEFEIFEVEYFDDPDIFNDELWGRLEEGLLYVYCDHNSEFKKIEDFNYDYEILCYKKVEFIECGGDRLKCKFKIDYDEIKFQVLEQDERLRKTGNSPKIWVDDGKYKICALHKPVITNETLYIRGEDRCDDYKTDKIIVKSNGIARETVFAFCSLIEKVNSNFILLMMGREIEFKKEIEFDEKDKVVDFFLFNNANFHLVTYKNQFLYQIECDYDKGFYEAKIENGIIVFKKKYEYDDIKQEKVIRLRIK